MFKQIILGVIAIFVVALMPTDSDAGCARVGGKQVCASWITGSEICKVKTKKIENVDCSAGVGFCPEVECTVFGTVGTGCATTLSPACDISGIIFTASNTNGAPFSYPNSLSNSTNVFFEDGDSNDDLFAATAAVAAAQSDSPCKKNGNCKATVEIEPNPSDPGVPADVITFTALIFNAQTKVCEGGIDGLGQCCNPSGQFFNGSTFACVTPYAGLTRVEQCTIKETLVKLDKSNNYKCVPFPPA